MKPEFLINQFLKRKKETNSAYSLRAFARDLQVSPSFLSEVLAGKKKVPPKWIKPIARILNLDEIALADLKTSVLLSHLEGTGLESLLDMKTTRTISKSGLSKPLGKKKLSALTKWYYIAVLDFLTLQNGPFKEEEIAERLELSVAAIRESLAVLNNLGLISFDKMNLASKTDLHIRVPTSKTDPTIRNFHVQMIEKAKFELLRKTKETDFAKRLITGSTMAVDPQHTEQIKKRLQVFMAEISQEFSKGKASELYQFNMQLFPLTK